MKTFLDMKLLVVGEPAGTTRALNELECRMADTPKAAWDLLQSSPPDVLVVGPAPWARQWVATLPPERRPAVLLVGADPDGPVAPDEWVSCLDDNPELKLRLRLARLRGRERRRVARRAMIDTLTGLPNRRAALVGLLHAAARAKRGEASVSLVVLDLDHFKAVNDTLGHDGGDRVLRKVGAAALRVARQDELIARIGGDEFALLIHGNLEAARSAARRVCSALVDVGVEATVGVAQLESGEGLRDFYRRADRALNAAKIGRGKRREVA